MPGRNGTGPFGEGPMTGRGLGVCNGHFNNMPRGGGVSGYYRGARCGRGLGYGRRSNYVARDGFLGANEPIPDPIDRDKALRAQAEYLKDQLEKVNKELGNGEE